MEPAQLALRLLLRLTSQLLSFFTATKIAHDSFDMYRRSVQRILEQRVFRVRASDARECAEPLRRSHSAMSIRKR